jgi:hypothetical protein
METTAQVCSAVNGFRRLRSEPRQRFDIMGSFFPYRNQSKLAPKVAFGAIDSLAHSELMASLRYLTRRLRLI